MRLFVSGLLILFISLALRAQDIKVENVHFESDGKQVVIFYDLKGDSLKDYNVEVSLKRENNTAYTYILSPDSLSGDLGKGKFCGNEKKIIWNISNVSTELFSGDDFYFEVNASYLKKGTSWYYYVGAAILAGGGTAVLLLNKKPESTITEAFIPKPPVRP